MPEERIEGRSSDHAICGSDLRAEFESYVPLVAMHTEQSSFLGENETARQRWQPRHRCAQSARLAMPLSPADHMPKSPAVQSPASLSRVSVQ